MMDTERDAIDIVIPWVDGNDPALRSRRMEAAARLGETDPGLFADDTAGDTRYADCGELRWSLASIFRFAPWARRVYIVTDGQYPTDAIVWAKKHFPTETEIEVVDHHVIFRGYEHLLPTFNSISIETMIWRIPGLADRYILFNDDTFFLAPAQPDQWFDGHNLVCHGFRFNTRWAGFLQWLKGRRRGHVPRGFKLPMANAARLLHSRSFVYYYHSPIPQSRLILEEFFSEHPGLLEQNASFPFRDPSQFSPQALCLILAGRYRRLNLIKSNTNLFLKPTLKKRHYLLNRLAVADRRPFLSTGCINSLDCASEEERQTFIRWIERRLQ